MFLRPPLCLQSLFLIVFICTSLNCSRHEAVSQWFSLLTLFSLPRVRVRADLSDPATGAEVGFLTATQLVCNSSYRLSCETCFPSSRAEWKEWPHLVLVLTLSTPFASPLLQVCPLPSYWACSFWLFSWWHYAQSFLTVLSRIVYSASSEHVGMLMLSDSHPLLVALIITCSRN